MILGFFVIEKDEPSTEDDKRVDWIGAALVTGGLVLIVFVLSDVPTAVTAVMITTAIRAAIRPYSMAVAPDSSFTKRLNRLVMIVSQD